MVEYFVGGEVFPKADGAGGTEETAEGTARLGGDTEGVVNTGFEFVGESDGFDLMMIGSFEENLVGLVTAGFVDQF